MRVHYVYSPAKVNEQRFRVYLDDRSQAAQSRCPVLTATFKVDGRWQISTPYRMETPSPIANKNDTRDYVREATSCAKFGANPPAGVFWGDGEI